jgi:hypothetical protein
MRSIRWLLIGILALAVMLPMPSGFAATSSETAAGKTDDGVIVYYFHGKRRCHTCGLLEEYAKETLDQKFSDALAKGEIQWRVLDVSKPENRHFVTDFGLVSQSLVLVRQADGEISRWKNLDKIWQKVRDETAYVEYVAEGIREFMETSQ